MHKNVNVTNNVIQIWSRLIRLCNALSHWACCIADLHFFRCLTLTQNEGQCTPILTKQVLRSMCYASYREYFMALRCFRPHSHQGFTEGLYMLSKLDPAWIQRMSNDEHEQTYSTPFGNVMDENIIIIIIVQKRTIQQVTTMQATSKSVLFLGHNHLLTTSADDPTLIMGRVPASEGSSALLVSRWLWNSNRTF